MQRRGAPRGTSCPRDWAPSKLTERPVISSPAEKARPEPVRTTTLMASSIWASKRLSTRSRFVGWVSPFIRSGWLKVISAMPGSWIATSNPRKVPVCMGASWRSGSGDYGRRASKGQQDQAGSNGQDCQGRRSIQRLQPRGNRGGPTSLPSGHTLRSIGSAPQTFRASLRTASSSCWNRALKAASAR